MAGRGSFVIVSRETGEAVTEIFDRRLLVRLNNENFRAVPILEWLSGLNAQTSN